MKQHINNKFWDDYCSLYEHYTPSIQIELLKEIGNLAFGNILDFGCGVGKLYPYLKNNKLTKKIYLLDSSKEMRKYTNNKMEKDKKTKVISDINQIKQKSINTITFVNSLYANSNPIEILFNSSKLLKKNDQIIISDMRRNCQKEKLIEVMKNEFPNDSKLEEYIELNKELMIGLIPRCY